MKTAVLALWAAVFFALPAIAEEGGGEDSRATAQERFASKEGRFYGHAAGTTLIRNDFYNSLGYGVDAGYFISESWGLELRVLNLHTWLGRAAEGLRDSHSLVPDLRAPDAWFTVGGRLSWGYGKILTLDRFVIHFDPQLTLHGGITLAEERIVPTTTLGVGFLTHWNLGIQVKVDLQLSFQMEQRERGWTPAFGFVPVVGIGWSPPRGSR